MEIMVDASQAGACLNPRGTEVWTYELALKTAQELEQLGAVWPEEPLLSYDFEHLAKLCGRMNCIRAVSIYIAGGEGNVGLHEFRTLIEDNVQPVLAKTGVIQPEGLGSEGISQLKKIAAMAEVHFK
jgi:L-alanine-DL-glutamate epimerase-like enolase superfamily enzyme